MKRQISAEVIADSLNTATGDRLTTIKAVFPWVVLPEFLTHRAFSRNGASTRAIPGWKMRKQVLLDPYTPFHRGKNQPGMQAQEELEGWKRWLDVKLDLWFRYPVLLEHFLRDKVLKAHKQNINKKLMPYLWMEVIVSATEWNNFFGLRDHPDADPNMARLAQVIRSARDASTPKPLKPGEWHLPFIDEDPQVSQLFIDDVDLLSTDKLKRTSTARNARVTNLLRTGERSDIGKDLGLYKRLVGASPRHLSPSEHVAMAMSERKRSGNFVGFMQHRKEFPDEAMGDYEGLEEETVLL